MYPIYPIPPHPNTSTSPTSFYTSTSPITPHLPHPHLIYPIYCIPPHLNTSTSQHIHISHVLFLYPHIPNNSTSHTPFITLTLTHLPHSHISINTKPSLGCQSYQITLFLHAPHLAKFTSNSRVGSK